MWDVHSPCTTPHFPKPVFFAAVGKSRKLQTPLWLKWLLTLFLYGQNLFVPLLLGPSEAQRQQLSEFKLVIISTSMTRTGSTKSSVCLLSLLISLFGTKSKSTKKVAIFRSLSFQNVVVIKFKSSENSSVRQWYGPRIFYPRQPLQDFTG